MRKQIRKQPYHDIITITWDLKGNKDGSIIANVPKKEIVTILKEVIKRYK